MEIVKEKRRSDVKPIADLNNFRRLNFPGSHGNSRRDSTGRLASSKYRVLPEISCDVSDESEKPTKSMDETKYFHSSGKPKKVKVSTVLKSKDRLQAETSERQNTENNAAVEPAATFVAHKSKVRTPVQRLTLAIKLPTGLRIVSIFKGSDPLKAVLRTAESKAGGSFRGCLLMCHEGQKIYSDLSQRLEDSGIEDKTTLYLQLPAKD